MSYKVVIYSKTNHENLIRDIFEEIELIVPKWVEHIHIEVTDDVECMSCNHERAYQMLRIKVSPECLDTEDVRRCFIHEVAHGFNVEIIKMCTEYIDDFVPKGKQDLFYKIFMNSVETSTEDLTLVLDRLI